MVVVVGSRVLFISAKGLLFTGLAYFCALSVNSVVATKLAPPLATLSGTSSLPVTSGIATPALSSYAVIYTRDIFNSVKAPHSTIAASPVSLGTSANLKLLGTATSAQAHAFAILEDQTTQEQRLYREGEIIAPGIALVQVGWDRVTIERDGKQETLLLPQEPASSAAPTLTPVAAPGSANTTEGIQQLSPDTFQIDRREVDHALNNLSDLFTQVRAVPYSPQSGVTQGFRLFSVKPASLIDRIGLKNGDIVQRVNGVEVSDPGTAFSLLQDLQGLSQIRVDILRNHQPTTLSYEIR